MVSVVLSKSAELRDKLGITVVLVEQNAKKALEIGDRAYIIVSGKKVYEDEAKDLLKNPELSKMYFGVE
jgi:branched-chain amino acid transport system ATP-binding protein